MKVAHVLDVFICYLGHNRVNLVQATHPHEIRYPKFCMIRWDNDTFGTSNYIFLKLGFTHICYSQAMLSQATDANKSCCKCETAQEINCNGTRGCPAETPEMPT